MRTSRPNYRSVRANDDEARGYDNPPRVLEVTIERRKVRVKISAGRGDDIDVARFGPLLIVCSLNRRFPYFGAEVFTLDGKPCTDFFCQGSDQCAAHFEQEAGEDGAPWEDWSERYLYSQLRRSAITHAEYAA